MAADRIHIAEIAPPHCSSCFGAKPKMTHVDFGAFYDGPVIGEGVTMHVIDDLIICEDCLITAGRKIGLGHVSEVEAELRNAELENDALMEKVRNLMSYAQALEAARDNRPNEILDPPPQRRPRKKVAA